VIFVHNPVYYFYKLYGFDFKVVMVWGCFSQIAAHCSNYNIQSGEEMKKQPKDDFNACQHFFTLVVHYDVLCAVMFKDGKFE